MQPAGSPATSATSSAAPPIQDGATAAPPAATSAPASLVTGQGASPTGAATSVLASLGEIVRGQGAPPSAILLQRPPRVRGLEVAALIAIVALADLALYQGGGGAGLAAL